MSDIVLKTENLTKHYGGVHALKARTLNCARRACRHHGRQWGRQIDLRAPNHGRRAAHQRQVCSDGKEVNLLPGRRRARGGIETVFQNPALADDLDVLSNLFLGQKGCFQPGPFSILDASSCKATRRRLSARR
jgi:fructose transport system ATP-binding protein